ncbi:MAG: response regulator, partial [Actinomycetota bacterium]
MTGISKHEQGPITVLVADSMPLFAEALGGVLSQQTDIRVLASRPSSGLDTVETVGSLRPDVALVDYWMPDMEGSAAVRLIRGRHPQLKVIILSWFHGAREIEESLNAGAVGFLPKHVTVAQVADAVRRAHAGESPVYLKELEEMFLSISRRGDTAAATWEKLQGLSKRQLQVLALLAENLAPKEAA